MSNSGIAMTDSTVPALCAWCAHLSHLIVKIANFESCFCPSSLFKEGPSADVPGSLPRSCLYNVLCDLGENDPVADCYMVGAQ